MVSLVEALPSETIVDITSTLAVKSIINCTLVCKFWKTLIPNPFLAKHNPTYFLFYCEESARFAIFDHEYDDHSSIRKDQIVVMMKPSFPGYNKITVFGSCNGLVCFSQSLMGTTLNIYLFNPVLGQSVTVPKPTLTYSPLTSSERYAFGFCPVTNHYKVFRSVYPIGDDYGNAEVEIYTIGSPEWRHIGRVPNELRVWSSPVCDRGSLHWIRSAEEDELRLTSIFTFNLATEEFGWTPPPPIGRDEIMYMLGYMDHCLVATAGPVKPVSSTDIWMRKESKWSRNWVFRGRYINHLLVPVAISADGVILMTYLHHIFCYDPKDKRATPHLVAYGLRRTWSGLVPYDATLVSPRDLMKDGSLCIVL